MFLALSSIKLAISTAVDSEIFLFDRRLKAVAANRQVVVLILFERPEQEKALVFAW